MRKAWAALAAVAAVAAAGATAPSPADAGDIGPGLAVGVAAGALTADAVAISPYDEYVYGPLPYRPYDSAPVAYGASVDYSRIAHARLVHRGSRIHSIVRVHHVARVYRVFDPYYGGGPFYYHHYCCRYW